MASKLTEAQRRDYPEYLDNMEAVVKLAAANFPRNIDVRIETAGSSPQASITLPWSVLSFLIDAGRTALEDNP